MPSRVLFSLTLLFLLSTTALDVNGQLQEKALSLFPDANPRAQLQETDSGVSTIYGTAFSTG